MSAEIIPFPAPHDLEFGGCPHCGRADGYLNVGRNHWFYCERHKTTWWYGSNIFSSWCDETEGEWLRNQYRLADYRVVEPRHNEQEAKLYAEQKLDPLGPDDWPFGGDAA